MPVYAVNAACLVPPAVLGDGIRGRSSFLRQHEPRRAEWLATDEAEPTQPAYAGPLPFTPDRLDEVDTDALVADLAIDHTLPVSPVFPAGRAAAERQLRRAVAEVLPGYAATRNDATRPDGASGLSPYLHFGVLGPRYAGREGGYIRVLKAGYRYGDNAPLAVIEFVDRDVNEKGKDSGPVQVAIED